MSQAISICILVLLAGDMTVRCQAGPSVNLTTRQLALVNAGRPNAQAKIDAYIDSLAAAIDPRARAALARIDGTGRKLLALRGYLRGGASLGARWSWGAAEIERYAKTAEHKAALDEVEKVKRKFTELNPGYDLYVNTQVRTLEAQINNWNETKSVQAAGDELVAAALKELSGVSYKDAPDAPSTNRLRRFLQTVRVRGTTVATPGLSPHGQMRAFDFQVRQGGRIIAGTESAAIGPVWDGHGWGKKLNEAVVAASGKFKGPLASPREPWHYEYVP